MSRNKRKMSSLNLNKGKERKKEGKEGEKEDKLFIIYLFIYLFIYFTILLQLSQFFPCCFSPAPPPPLLQLLYTLFSMGHSYMFLD